MMHALSVLAASLLFSASPSEAQGLGMAEVVEQALVRNPILKSAEERRQELAGGIQEARANALPSLELVSGWNVSRNPSLLNSPDFEEFVDNFPGGSFKPRRQTLYNLSAELTQPLFTWGKVGAALDLARTAVEVAEAQISTVRLDTAAEAAEAYFQLARAVSAAEALEVQRRTRTAALQVVEARFELGDATRLELLRSKASSAALEPEFARSNGAVEVARSRLRRVLGLGITEEVHLRLPEVAIPTAPGIQGLLTQAQERPEQRDLDRQVEALRHRVRTVRADGKPQLELNGAFGRTVRRPEDLENPLFRDWRLSIDLHWGFFDGGRRRGQVAQLESQRRQLMWLQQDLDRRIAEEVSVAHSAFVAARARWQAAQTAADAAQEAGRVAQESYREGAALQVDLLGAQEQDTLAELERIEARFDAFIQWVRLERSLGRIPLLPNSSPAATDTPVGEEAP